MIEYLGRLKYGTDTQPQDTVCGWYGPYFGRFLFCLDRVLDFLVLPLNQYYITLLGNIGQGIFHLSNAVVTCRQSTELMTIFRQSIPAEHYLLLSKSIPAAREVISNILS